VIIRYIAVVACLWAAVAAVAVTSMRANAGPKATHPALVICSVFGQRYCLQALEVSWCESRFSTTARNGTHLGLFQMGLRERRLYGHGADAWSQARAAHRYFVNSGRDWSPWACTP